MSLTKQDLQSIKTIVTDAIGANNSAIAEMFEAQNTYIDQRFDDQDKRIDVRFIAERAITRKTIDERLDARFIEERAIIRSIVHEELEVITKRVEKLERIQIADTKEALDRIAALEKQLSVLKQAVLKVSRA